MYYGPVEILVFALGVIGHETLIAGPFTPIRCVPYLTRRFPLLISLGERATQPKIPTILT